MEQNGESKMWTANQWQDYCLIDGCDGMKLERWGDFVYQRPDPQIIWKEQATPQKWNRSDGIYFRSATGGGNWNFPNPKAEGEQVISYRDLRFMIKPMGFKHMGLFPEQAVNWDFMREQIESARREIRVLNLFGYTGGATVACIASGASVCHVDAAKGIVAHAKRNIQENKMEGPLIRYIVDDAVKFVTREIKRGKKYDAIVMDPPSYGRGPGGEVWKIEDELYGLVDLCSQVLSDNPLFFLINSYTTGLAPTAVKNLMTMTLVKKFGGKVTTDEIGLPFANSELILPCGCTARWQS